MRTAKLAALLAFLLGSVPVHAGALPDKARIAATAKRAMSATGSRGLAIAVIDKGKVVSVQAFGDRNAKGDPLTPQTIMYGASLTKVVFAYTVLRLVDEGKVDLDTPIAAMLKKPLPEYGNLDAYGNWGDLAGDERWRTITPRMVFNHATGFANFSFLEPDGSCGSISIRAAAMAIRARGSCCSSSGSSRGWGSIWARRSSGWSSTR